MHNRRSERLRGNVQSKLNFSSSNRAKATTGANASNMATAEGDAGNATILKAIKDLQTDFSKRLDSVQTDFSKRFDSVMMAIEGIRKEVGECIERVDTAETRISTTEDLVASLQSKIQSLEKKYKEMELKVTSMERRSRRSNLRLCFLPEKAEQKDACGFLEKWIAQTLGIATTIEVAHRIGKEDNARPDRPRTMIMKFLDNRDKVKVMEAARAKDQILYEGKTVKFYPDLTDEVRKKQKEFDSVRKKLREITGIRQGMLFPARLLVTYKNKTKAFDSPEDVKDFISRITTETGRLMDAIAEDREEAAAAAAANATEASDQS